MSEKALKYFLYEIFPFILTFIGFFSNLFIIIIFSRKRLNTAPSKNLFKLLAIVDFIYCLVSFTHINQATFIGYSKLTCNLGTYGGYLFPAISAWLLSCISIEKLLAIMKPTLKDFFKKANYQIFICLFICSFNSLLYSPIVMLNDFYHDINSTQIKDVYFDRCDIFQSQFGDLLSNFDLVQGVILPFIVMFTCSIYLVMFIFKSRKRAFKTRSVKSKRILKKDIQFAMNTLFLDILFIIFNIPLAIFMILEINYLALIFLFFFNFRSCSNLFIYLIFNTIFRKEFLFLLKQVLNILNIV